MAKGKKHYSGKELIRRRQIERQQAEQQQGNRLTKTLKQVNQLRPVIERAKQRMREGKENGSVLDRNSKSTSDIHCGMRRTWRAVSGVCGC